jgi:hypothetical protein
MIILSVGAVFAALTLGNPIRDNKLKSESLWKWKYSIPFRMIILSVGAVFAAVADFIH